MVDRMPAAVYQDLVKPKKGGRVRGARKVKMHGHCFDSQLECDRYFFLETLQRVGEISQLDRQVPFPLHGQLGPVLTDSGKAPRHYIADAVYFLPNGLRMIEDAKGWQTDVSKIKLAIMQAQGQPVAVVKTARGEIALDLAHLPSSGMV